MKKNTFLLITLLILISCKKQSTSVEPSVDFIIGHLSDSGSVFHLVNNKNQDTIFRSELDTVFSVTVSEKNLDLLHLNPKIILEKNFTIYINSSNDFERFNSGNRHYSFGGGGGVNNDGYVSNMDYSFLIPLRLTNPVINNDKIEISSQGDFLRISYESNYSNLSKVKTVIIR
jgi:hypothetical protein